MVTLEMATSGPVSDVGEVVWLSMAVNTRQHKGFIKLSAVAISKAPTESASGVTIMVKDQ